MTVLVAYASKHESTHGIAERIAATIRKHGQQVVAMPVGHIDSLAGYDAFVIGSGVYAGSWIKEAVEFVQQYQTTLARHPVWLFSSGPLGPKKAGDEVAPRQIAQIEQATHAREHRIFYGALDPDKLSFLERTIFKAVKAPSGDFRDWPEIEAWAENIASALQPAEAARS